MAISPYRRPFFVTKIQNNEFIVTWAYRSGISYDHPEPTEYEFEKTPFEWLEERWGPCLQGRYRLLSTQLGDHDAVWTHWGGCVNKFVAAAFRDEEAGEEFAKWCESVRHGTEDEITADQTKHILDTIAKHNAVLDEMERDQEQQTNAVLRDYSLKMIENARGSNRRLSDIFKQYLISR